MKGIQKFLALFLILCLALSLAPAAFADGEEEAPVIPAEGDAEEVPVVDRGGEEKISDNFLIITPWGSCTVLLSEILNFNEKAVNFRFTYTGSGLEIFSNGELCKSIGSAEMA